MGNKSATAKMQDISGAVGYGTQILGNVTGAVKGLLMDVGFIPDTRRKASFPTETLLIVLASIIVIYILVRR